MKKADINHCMVFKMRGGDVCALLLRATNEHVFYSKSSLERGYYSGQSNLREYTDDLMVINPDDAVREFDIVSTKEFPSQNEAINCVLNDKSIIKWDWIREDSKKEMTVEEIEKQLGHKVKIIGNKY